MKSIQTSKSNTTAVTSGLDEENSGTQSTQVNPESTTAEFKKYLDELKRNYLEKLTFSCPPKLTESRQSATPNLNTKSTNNATSLVNSSNIRRSLYFDTKLDNLEEDSELMMRLPAGKKSSFTAFKSDTLGRDEAASVAGFDTKLTNILETVTS